MKTLLKSLATFIFFSNLAIAGYSCPPDTSSAGGWVPPECQNSVSEDEGIVETINKVEGSGEASGVGAVAGAVAGGALGNIASKKNKTLSTVIGAVAGGVAGHYGEKYLKKTTSWDITVKMNSGENRTFSVEVEPEFKVGDAVIVSGDSVFKKLQ